MIFEIWEFFLFYYMWFNVIKLCSHVIPYLTKLSGAQESPLVELGDFPIHRDTSLGRICRNDIY